MLLVSKTYWAGMPFWFRTTPEHARVESLVLRAHDLRQLRALYWTSDRHPAPKVGVVVIHPRVDFSHHYAIPRLIDAGYGVVAANTRYAGNDTLGEHEEMVLDVAACVHHLREQRRVERVVLLGNCGGGSLVAFYQAQARIAPEARLARSPAGDPTHFAAAAMTPADALIFVAPHRGQGHVLRAAIDPSVIDERDPLGCDPALDMYDARNGFREAPEWSSYDPQFIARYRDAQTARVARLDATARELIARQTEAHGSDRDSQRRRACEPIIVVYRTMANPAFVDRGIDPSGRDYGSLLSERPDLMNYAALGLARTCTPRAWLSTWSALSSNADLVANGAHIQEPTLVVHAGRDREVFPSDIAAIGQAIAAADKQVHTIEPARHYFEPELGSRDGHVEPLMDVVIPWIAERVS
jgi:dienelactone hydrolase